MQTPPGSVQIPQLALQQTHPSSQMAVPHSCTVGHSKNLQKLNGSRPTVDPSSQTFASFSQDSPSCAAGHGKNLQLLYGSRTTMEPSSQTCKSLVHPRGEGQGKNWQSFEGSRSTEVPSSQTFASSVHDVVSVSATSQLTRAGHPGHRMLRPSGLNVVFFVTHLRPLCSSQSAQGFAHLMVGHWRSKRLFPVTNRPSASREAASRIKRRANVFMLDSCPGSLLWWCLLLGVVR